MKPHHYQSSPPPDTPNPSTAIPTETVDKSRNPMKATENPYCGAVVIGLGVVMPDPKQPGKFVLPGGITCDRQTAEAAAKKIHDLQAKKARN